MGGISIDFITIIAAALGGLGGGLGGSSLLIYVLRSQGQGIRDNSKSITQVRRDLGREIGNFKRDNEKQHTTIYKRIEEEEDCVESELLKLNKNLTKVITVIKLTSPQEVRDALEGI